MLYSAFGSPPDREDTFLNHVADEAKIDQKWGPCLDAMQHGAFLSVCLYLPLFIDPLLSLYDDAYGLPCESLLSVMRFGLFGFHLFIMLVLTAIFGLAPVLVCFPALFGVWITILKLFYLK
jgi:hypothetical protein